MKTVKFVVDINDYGVSQAEFEEINTPLDCYIESLFFHGCNAHFHFEIEERHDAKKFERRYREALLEAVEDC